MIHKIDCVTNNASCKMSYVTNFIVFMGTLTLIR